MKIIILKIAFSLVLLALLAPALALAQIDTITSTIPLISPLDGSKSFDAGKNQALGNYINDLYFYAIGLGALLAMAVIIFGAIRYITEKGKPFMQSEAKVWIFSGVIGLILLLSATLILTTLNKGISDLTLIDNAVLEAEKRGQEAAATNSAVDEARANRVANSRKEDITRIIDDIGERLRRGFDGPIFSEADYYARFSKAVARTLIEQEWSKLYNDPKTTPAELEGFLQGIQEAVNKYDPALQSHGLPSLAQEYLKEKAAKHRELARAGEFPSSQLDVYLKENNKYPQAYIEILSKDHYDGRKTGTEHEMSESGIDGNRIAMWETVTRISQNGDVASTNFPGHIAAKNGVYDGFIERMTRHYSDPDINIENYLEYAEGQGLNTWLVERLRKNMPSTD